MKMRDNTPNQTPETPDVPAIDQDVEGHDMMPPQVGSMLGGGMERHAGPDRERRRRRTGPASVRRETRSAQPPITPEG